MKKKKNAKPSLSKGEQKAMDKLAKRKDISIANADKGSAVVIMYIEKCINKANSQLSDKHNYKALQEDPTLQHSNLVNLSKTLTDRLKSVNPKLPKFYISPKICKETTQEDQ